MLIPGAAVVVLAAGVGEAGQDKVTSIKGLLSLTRKQAAAGLPVRLRAVVTYCYEQTLFVDQGGKGLYLQRRPEDRERIPPGWEVEVVGRTRDSARGRLQLISVKRVRPGVTPEPRRVNGEMLNRKLAAAQWVEVAGAVIKAHPAVDHMQIHLECDGGPIICRVFGQFTDDQAAAWVGRLVTVRAAVGRKVNDRKEWVRPFLHCPGVDFIRSAPDDPRAAERYLAAPKPIADIDFGRLGASERVTVAGVLTYRLGTHAAVQDETGAAWLQLPAGCPARTGDAVRASGVPAVGDGAPLLRHVFCASDGVADRRPAAAALDAFTAGPERLDGRVVRVLGALVTAEGRGGGWSMTVRGPSGATVRVESVGEGGVPAWAAPGTRVRAEGVYDAGFGSRGGRSRPVVWVDNPSGVRLLEAAPFWTEARARTGFWLMTFGFGMAALTAMIAARKARGQARQLRKQSRREETLEGRLLQAAKLEAIGRLAGGVAHDFNNLLTVINGNAEVLAGRLKAHPEEAELAEGVRQAGERAAALTGQLLSFSRRDAARPGPLDAAKAVADAADLLRRLVGERVEVAIDAPPKPVWVRDDSNLLTQVLVNLAANARDAMPDGGTLRLTVEPAGPIGSATLRVADNGVGMDAATKERLFEPFFTTKPVGSGTGLGLSVVYGAVRSAGGSITVDSEPGRGTTFTIELPAAEPSGPSSAPRTKVRPALGRERVLLVEDDDAVRAFAARVLESQGYTLEVYGSPEKALAAEGHVDLLVTDVVMPGLNGRELAERLRGRLPDLRVLFMSGYNEDEVLRAGLEGADGVGLLQKPFRPADLARRVREMLDGREG